MDPITTAVVSNLASKATDKVIDWAKENPGEALGAAALATLVGIGCVVDPNPTISAGVPVFGE
jgi:ABC-type taurine transport system substrate-binding protein